MNNSPTSLDPVLVLSALANAQRLQIIGLMAQGTVLTINELVRSQGRSYKSVHKDLGVLCAAGAVSVSYGEDRRVGLFAVPETFRPQRGVVDYGCCAVRFGAAATVGFAAFDLGGKD